MANRKRVRPRYHPVSSRSRLRRKPPGQPVGGPRWQRLEPRFLLSVSPTGLATVLPRAELFAQSAIGLDQNGAHDATAHSPLGPADQSPQGFDTPLAAPAANVAGAAAAEPVDSLRLPVAQLLVELADDGGDENDPARL